MVSVKLGVFVKNNLTILLTIILLLAVLEKKYAKWVDFRGGGGRYSFRTK